MNRPEIDGRLAGIDRAALMSVADTADAMRAASLEAWRSERQAERDQVRPPSTVEAAVAGILASTMTGTDFAARLDEKGLAITRATAIDVQAIEALRAADVSAGTTGDLASGRRFANLVEGDLAVVTRQGDVFRLSPHKLDAEEIEQRLADVQPRLPSVVEARAAFEIDRERKADQRSQNEADYIAARLDQADAFAGKQELRQTVHAAEGGVHTFFAASAAAIDNGLDAASGLFGGAAKIAGSLITALGSFFGDSEPKITRHQAEQQVKAATNEETLHGRQVAADTQTNAAAIDWLIFEQNRVDQQNALAKGSSAAASRVRSTATTNMSERANHRTSAVRDTAEGSTNRATMGAIKALFQKVAKIVTRHRDSEPQPKTRRQRKGGGDTRCAFPQAADTIAGRDKPASIRHATIFLSETLDWLHSHVWHHAASPGDDHGGTIDAAQNHLSPHL